MAHYAEIDENNFVKRVIVVSNSDEPTEVAGAAFCSNLLGGKWIKTSYNTRANVHYDQDGTPDGGVALRGNYAGIGYIYDSVNDVFYPPKPYPSWHISGDTNWIWTAPTPMPNTGGPYIWDEANTSWTAATTG
jgi:hypothetical protein